MPSFEKIEYKPIPVRELLREMKNLSELMIDLAYSAALFNDRELAEDVLELERRMDTLAYQLEMVTMVAVRDAEDAEALVGVSKVAAAADKISEEKDWIINPKGKEKICAGDILIARGASEGLKELKELCEGKRDELEG